ncbi:MAG: hypothetical protein ACREQA_19795 [Candidatus Binatia bacterium]
MEALGRLLDVSIGAAPKDLNAATTGKRVKLQGATGVTILFVKDAGTAGEDPVLTLKEHNADTGGTSQNLAVIAKHYQKQEATLDGDEKWSKVTQTKAATLTLNATSAEEEGIYAVYVGADQLSDGFAYVSLDVAATTTAGQLGVVVYILHDLTVQRAPENMAAPLRA